MIKSILALTFGNALLFGLIFLILACIGFIAFEVIAKRWANSYINKVEREAEEESKNI